jgi:hypothetical protein
MDKVYNVGKIRKLIAESSNEFKPVIGKNVESDNKKNNGKANKDSMDKVKKYDNGLKDEKNWARGDAEYEKTDGNHTTLGHNPENASKEYKKRVKANALGYSSEQEMNNDYEKAADYSDNEKFFNTITKNEKEMDDNVKKFKKTGLQAREMDDKTFDKETLYESKDGFDMRQMMSKMSERISEMEQNTQTSEKPLKTIYYKKTEFITEQHMLSKIPDEFKVNGTKVKMKDKTGNEYIVEWQNNTGNIINHTNKSGFGESINKIKHLVEYTSPESTSNHSSRIKEDDEMFSKTLNTIRKTK